MEAPLSHVEAILQNILGADNVLVPPQSRVEAILLAILNNTEYIHPGDPSRVEEILLAIKDGGNYDKKALSRVEDILIHKLNDEEYTDYSEDDLSRVEKLLIQWIDLHPEVIKELTTSSFPISILANGLPLLDYRIYGNTVQNGTPTPDNPIMPQGTGERTGNLCDIDGFTSWESEIKLLQTIRLNAGTYTYSCIQQTALTSNIRNCLMIRIGSAAYTYESTQTNYHLSTGRHSMTFTVPADNTNVELRYWINNFSNSCNFDSFMLNTGSTALPYEPYGYKIPISSANTTTPIYLGEVETTRKIKKLVLDGNTGINPYSSGSTGVGFVMQGTGMLGNRILGKSSHFRTQSTGDGSTIDGVTFGINNTTIYFTFSANSVTTYELTDIASIKQYLAAQYAAGTPVTVWYVLATEKTGIVNEPLCRIGDYADSVDFSQAGVEIPTLKKPNTTVIDVETSLEPSSMYLKYTEPSGPTPKTPVLGTKDIEIYVTPNNEIYVLRR